MKHQIPNKSHTWYAYREHKYYNVELYYAEEDESGELVLYRQYDVCNEEQGPWWKTSNPEFWSELNFSDDNWEPVTEPEEFVEIGFDAVFEYPDKIILYIEIPEQNESGAAQLILDKSKYAICRRK